MSSAMQKIVKRLRKPFTATLGDFAIAGVTSVIVGFSVYLPLDAYINAEKYGPPKMAFSLEGLQSGELIAIKQGMNVQRDILTGEFLSAYEPVEIISPQVHALTTGTTETSGKPEQPAGAFRTLFVRGGSALLEGPNGYLTVQVGTKLPDGSSVVFIFDDGKDAGVQTNRATYSLQK